MKFSGADADFSSQSHFSAIMQASAGINKHCRGINGAGETLGNTIVCGDDCLGMARSVSTYVGHCIFWPVNQFYTHD
jgi:hypothetical protein